MDEKQSSNQLQQDIDNVYNNFAKDFALIMGSVDMKRYLTSSSKNHQKHIIEALAFSVNKLFLDIVDIEFKIGKGDYEPRTPIKNHAK